MPERLGFDRELSGRTFLAHHWRLSGGDPARTETEVTAAAEKVGLDVAALAQKLRTYSRGMLQRIGVAQAIFRRSGDPVSRRAGFRDRPARRRRRPRPDSRGQAARRDDRLELPPAGGGGARLRPGRVSGAGPGRARGSAARSGRGTSPRDLEDVSGSLRAGGLRPGRGGIRGPSGYRRHDPPRRLGRGPRARRPGAGRAGRPRL